MERNYSKLLKVVSIVLLLAMMATSQTFVVLASEFNNIEVFSHEDAILRDILAEGASLPTSEATDDELVTPELLALLERSHEYDSFTEEEKRMFQAFFHMAVDEEEHQKALDAQAEIQREIDAMPEKMRYESYVHRYTREGKTYSTLNQEERNMVLGFSELPETAEQAFLFFEAQGLDLFDSMVAVEIMSGDLFTAEESLLLFNMYGERDELERNVLGFKNFAKAFVGETFTLSATEYIPDSLAARRAEIIAQKTEYVSADALKDAKQMLLNGYTSNEIRAAYIVAATYDLIPSDLLVKKAETPMVMSNDAQEAFFDIYPVNLSVLHTELAAIPSEMHTDIAVADMTATMTATVAAEPNYSSMAAEIASTGAVLYSSLDEVEDDPVEDVIEQPFDIGHSERENISLNTGALQYSEPIAVLPEVNGESVSLCVEYDSSDSSLEKYSYSKITGTKYAIVGTRAETVAAYSGDKTIIGTEEDYIAKGYSTAEAAIADATAILQSKETCTLTTPYKDSRYVSLVWHNTCKKKWYTNPYELIFDTQSNPAPDSFPYSSGGYTGTLPIKSTVKTYDNGTETFPTTQEGREIKYQETKWEATYSGTVSKTITTGYYTYSDLMVVEYKLTSVSNRTNEQTHNEQHFDIGSGWSFNIPSIDTNAKSRRLILPGKGTYSLDGNTIEDYSLKDMILVDDSSYSNGQFSSAKKLKFADGTVYYFSSDGLLLADVDRFGNTITYAYAKVDGEYHPAKITDAFGRKITIVYEVNDTGKTITITAPDGEATMLYIKDLDNNVYGDGNSILERIEYSDGETIGFEYELEEGTYNFKSSVGGSTIHYALLKKVSYATGAELHYAYELKDTKLGQGHLDVYRITERYTVDTASENTVVDKTQYSYSEDYSRGKDYKTTVARISTNGTTTTEYTFNKDHLCTMQIHKVGSSTKQKVETTYNQTYDLPEKIKTTAYGEAGKIIETTELYTYDEFGNIKTYVSPKAEGAESNAEYRTTNTYSAGLSGSTYFGSNLPLTVSYKQDADTTVLIQYGLINNNKSIGSITTSVNGTVVSKTEYDYDALGRVVSETAFHNLDADSNNTITTVYIYNDDAASDNYGMLSSVIVSGVEDNDGNIIDIATEYTYDKMGRPLVITDFNGNRTTTEYDNRGRKIKTVNADGSYTEFIYDTVNNITKVEYPLLDALIYDYDSIGRIESMRDANGTFLSENFYDENGRLLAEATGRGSTAANTVYYDYDAFDRVVEKVIYDANNRLAYRETYEYNDVLNSTTALVIKTVHGNGDTPDLVQKTYTNKYGEVIKEDVGGVITEYAYDYVGNPVRVYYGSTTLATYTYDHNGNMLTETNAAGDTRTVTYDAIGRKVSETDFKGNATVYTYDNAGRLLTMTAPLSDTTDSITKFYYDANGNIVKQQQSAQADDSTVLEWRTVEQTYDAMNRITDITNYVDEDTKQYTHYVYDLAGDLTDVYTGLSAPWSSEGDNTALSHIAYTYDGRGNNTSLTDAMEQTESYEYDALGMLISATQRDGKVIRYTYNAFGNVVSDAVYANSTAETPLSQKTTVYTLTGAVASATIDGETVAYTYDALGNVLTETEGNVVKAYTYDARGRRSGYTLTVDGVEKSTASYTYDNLDRLTSVTEGGKTTTYTYDANGNRVSQTVDGVTTTYTYNKANLVINMTNSTVDAEGNSIVISAFVYTYYADGNMRTKVEATADEASTTTYVYDGMGRLLSETKDETTVSYTYDANGNRTQMDNDGVITAYTYDANNRLVTEGDTTYTYDANGNMLSAGRKIYSYNARGQQTGYTEYAEAVHAFADGVCTYCGEVQTYMLADADGNGVINFLDFLISMRYYVDVPEELPPKDLDGDGIAGKKDYLIFARELGDIDENYIPNPFIIDDLLAFADVDGSGEVGATDYLIAYATLYEKEISECLTNGISLKTSMQAADINGDGAITEEDKEIGIDYALSGSSTYPIGETVENTYPCHVAANTVITSAQYAYNPSGLRSSKTVGGSTKYFVYNGMNIVFEYDDVSETLYYYGLNRTHNSDGEIYVYNAHGDTVQLVQNNAVTVSYAYDAFGNLTSQVGESNNAFLYCSEYFDTETGTYYLRARYYNPANGRFNAEDPHWDVSNRIYGDNPIKMNEHEDTLGLNKYTLQIDYLAVMQSGNLYVYCLNNPISYADYSGQEAITIGFGILFVIGGVLLTAAAIELIRTAPPITSLDLPDVSLPDVSLRRILGIAAPILTTAPQTKADSKETTKVKDIEASSEKTEEVYNYSQAFLEKGNVVLGKPMTAQEAATYVASGGNIMCANHAAAKHIIYLNNYKNAVGPEKHGDDYYSHYHPTRNHTGTNSVHIWYYGE